MLTKVTGAIWAKENKHQFEGLKNGVVYVLFENGERYRDDEFDLSALKYKQTWNKAGVMFQFKFSDNGNKYITKLAICEKCGKHIASSRLKVPRCDRCQYNKKIKNNHARYKPSENGTIQRGASVMIEKPKKIKASTIANCITGDYDRIETKVNAHLLEPTFDDLYFDCEMMPESERKWKGV